MTEAEWLVCTHPEKLVGFLANKVSERQHRLFACACCRETWATLSDERLKAAIEATEQFADGFVAADALESSHLSASDALESLRVDASEQRWHYVHESAAVAVFQACRRDLNHIVLMEVIRYATSSSVFACDLEETTAWQRQEALLAGYVRDIFGNPFRSATIDPTWLTPTATTLALAAYNDRRLPSGELEPPRLAVLSDALEEAGCTDADLLSHLRSPGPHVRGCWALDRVLGKQ